MKRKPAPAGKPVEDYSDRLAPCYTGAVYDVLRGMGHRRQALPSGITALNPESKLAGVIYTVSGRPAPELDAHETLLRWTALLSKAPKGAIVVCQPNDSTLAHMGELSAETLTYRGVKGYVVDGGCRDTEFILRLGFPVFCRYKTPVDVVGRWAAETFGEPIEIGGVRIETGDYLLADRDGAVIIPAALVDKVVTQTEKVMRTENKVRTAILQGVDPQEAYLKYGKF
ncbi:MAG: RraA family protein [Verrucomicrobia bacterium]|jgi:regulator of RNase E activity RraA|nr:RraA family protein [Verrucomicrobiota bacterium]